MASPPVKKRKDSVSISMVVGKWKYNQMEQFSPIYQINGYPWRLRLSRIAVNSPNRCLYLHCDMSSVADLWKCTAKIETSFNDSKSSQLETVFNSWDERSQKVFLIRSKLVPGTSLNVEIVTNDDGKEWRHRPIVDPFEQRDGILEIGDEKKKICVHKQSLASQSSFFDRLFYGDCKEKDMDEILIPNVEYEEFSNLLKLVYGLDGIPLTDENVHKVLQLSARFDVKIVEDRVVSYLLSLSSSLSIHEKLLISEQYNLPFLKKMVIYEYSTKSLKELREPTICDQLSKETVQAIIGYVNSYSDE